MFVFISYLTAVLILAKCETENKTTKLTYEEDATVNEIASALVRLFRSDDRNKRIEDLKEKLKKINSYVIDRNKYAEVLINETKSSNLNHTNFYNALNESDHFQFLISGDEPKNLYLRLKEKMNRDDIMKILANKGQNTELAKSARKMMSNDLLGSRVNKYSAIDMVVDKLIAEKPNDKHTFDYHKGDDNYWGDLMF